MASINNLSFLQNSANFIWIIQKVVCILSSCCQLVLTRGDISILFLCRQSILQSNIQPNTGEKQNKTENLDTISLDQIDKVHQRCFYSQLFHDRISEQNNENDVSSHSCGAVPYKQHCTSIHNMDSIYVSYIVTLSIRLKHCPSSCVQMTEEPPMYLWQYFPSILAKVEQMTKI